MGINSQLDGFYFRSNGNQVANSASYHDFPLNKKAKIFATISDNYNVDIYTKLDIGQSSHPGNINNSGTHNMEVGEELERETDTQFQGIIDQIVIWNRRPTAHERRKDLFSQPWW